MHCCRNSNTFATAPYLLLSIVGGHAMRNTLSKMPTLALYGELRALAESFPDLTYQTPVTDDRHRWMGRATALIGEALGLAAENEFKLAQGKLDSMNGHERGVEEIKTLVFKAIATIEFELPVGQRGAFIPAGNVFDAMAAVGRIFSEATIDLLIVDPYLDEKFLIDFAQLANEGTPLRLLRDAHQMKASLAPMARTWVTQHGRHRPIEIRLAAPRTLHDRLIVVDEKHVWNVGQSFNNLAGRAPTSFIKTDPGTSDLKIRAYETIWAGATPL
jgi:hypothetical protein